MTEYFSLFSTVKNVPEITTKQVLPSLRWKDRGRRAVEEELTNNDALTSRITTLEKEQLYQLVQIEIFTL